MAPGAAVRQACPATGGNESGTAVVKAIDRTGGTAGRLRAGGVSSVTAIGQWSHPRVLELGQLRARIALERLEARQSGLRLVGAAEPLQRLELSVVGAA